MTTRARVFDLGYGEVEAAAGRIDLRSLLDQIDADPVTVNGRTVRAHEMWRTALGDIVGVRSPAEPPPLLGVPTTWGTVRCAPIVAAAAAVGVVVVPRAVLIARSHADLSTRRCAVVETTRLPSMHGIAVSEDTEFDVAVLIRTDGDWLIESSASVVLDASELEVLGIKEYSRVAVVRSDAALASATVLSSTGARTITEIVDDSIDMVLVDGADPAQVALVVAVMEDISVAGRVLVVDRTLIRRFGAPRPLPARRAARTEDGTAETSPVRRAMPLVGGVLVLGLIGLAVLGLLWPKDTRERSTEVVVEDVALTVPHDWRRTSVTGADDAPDRTVFVDADDGRRLLVVRSEVRSTATLDSVATSLSHRIAQRGDDVVTEFSSSTRYGGREVISYREAPGSGSAIRWYVAVANGVQVSIGCQGGDEGESVEGVCELAVRSVRVGAK